MDALPRLRSLAAGQCAMLGATVASLRTGRETFGQLPETFALQELGRLASRRDDDIRCFR